MMLFPYDLMLYTGVCEEVSLVYLKLLRTEGDWEKNKQFLLTTGVKWVCPVQFGNRCGRISEASQKALYWDCHLLLVFTKLTRMWCPQKVPVLHKAEIGQWLQSLLMESPFLRIFSLKELQMKGMLSTQIHLSVLHCLHCFLWTQPWRVWELRPHLQHKQSKIFVFDYKEQEASR